jgi:hypothetical protein
MRKFRLLELFSAQKPPRASYELLSQHTAPLDLDPMAGLQTDSAIVAGLSEAHQDEYQYEKKHVASDSIPEHEPDDIHDGLVFPTEEERITLRRVADTIPWNAYRELLTIFSPVRQYLMRFPIVIAIVELAERFSVKIPLSFYMRLFSNHSNF